MMRIIVLRNDEIDRLKNGEVVAMNQDGAEIHIMSEEAFEIAIHSKEGWKAKP